MCTLRFEATRCTALFLLLLVILNTLSCSIPLSSNNIGVRKVKVYVPSVIDGKVGKVHLVEAWFTKGNGEVIIKGPQNIGEDTLYSAKFSKIVVEKLLGINITDVDIIISISGVEAAKIEGPSAGLAFALLIMALVTGDKLPSELAVTGAINIDGGVEAVGGVLIKMRAIAKANISRMILPRANLSPVIIKEAIKLGVRLLPVSTIVEAYEILTGRRIVKYIKPVIPYEISKMFQRNSYYIYNKTLHLMKVLMEINASRKLSLKLRTLINNSINYCNELMSEYSRAIKNQDYYSAASIAFTMYLNLSSTYVLLTMPKDPKVLDNEFKKLNNTINRLLLKLKNYNISIIDHLIWELLVTIATRINLARDLLRDYNEYVNVSDKILVLTRCKARIETTKLWFNILDSLTHLKYTNITINIIRNITLKAINIAKELFRYLKALLGVANVKSESYLNELQSKLREAENLYSLGEMVFAYSRALEVVYSITTSLSYVTLNSLNETSINEHFVLLKSIVGDEISYLINLGFMPFNSIYYYEYSGYGPMIYRFMWLKYADTYATPLILYLAEKGIKHVEVYKIEVSPREVLTIDSRYIAVTCLLIVMSFALGYFIALKRQIVKEGSRSS